MTKPARIASPCTGVCTIDTAGLCRGCARTLDEIARWGSLALAERRSIMAVLPDRRAGAPNEPA